jgi:hypothetical protein
MSLTDELLKADTKKINELKEGVYESKMLAQAIGKEGTVKVKIREIPTRRLVELMDGTISNSSEVHMLKMYEASKKVVLAGVVDPDLKDKDLQAHFGCNMGIDLVEVLFKGEVMDLSNAIQSLSSLAEASEEDIKN